MSTHHSVDILTACNDVSLVIHSTYMCLDQLRDDPLKTPGGTLLAVDNIINYYFIVRMLYFNSYKLIISLIELFYPVIRCYV